VNDPGYPWSSPIFPSRSSFSPFLSKRVAPETDEIVRGTSGGTGRVLADGVAGEQNDRVNCRGDDSGGMDQISGKFMEHLSVLR